MSKLEIFVYLLSFVLLLAFPTMIFISSIIKPKEYRNTPNSKEFEESRWYAGENNKISLSKSKAPVLLILPLYFLVATVSGFFVRKICMYKINCFDGKNYWWLSETSILGGWLLLSVMLLCYYIYFSKRPIIMSLSQIAFHIDGRLQSTRVFAIIQFIITFLGMSMFVLGINYYVVVGEEKIIYSNYFSFSQKELSYKELQVATDIVVQPEQKSIMIYCELKNKDRMLVLNGLDDISLLHILEKLEEEEVKIEKGYLIDDEMQLIMETGNDYQKQFAIKYMCK